MTPPARDPDEPAGPERIPRLLPVLAWIETHLDEDLSLASLAAVASLSPHHFHRLFRDAVGETPKRYVQRLRLERAAYLLGVQDGTVLDVALDVGFRSHATFTRAFGRRFGTPPSDFRARWRSDVLAPRLGRREGIEAGRPAGALSATRLRSLRAIRVACIRHLGDYEEVPASLWDELLEWARRTGGENAGPLLGVGHDPPSLTPVDKLRFDACLRVASEPPPEGRIVYRTIPGGRYAVTSHVGPFSTLSAAWTVVFRRVLELGHTPMLPAIEVYQSTRITPHSHLNRTELWLPVGSSPATPPPA